MPVVKLGSGAQTQAKPWRVEGRGTIWLSSPVYIWVFVSGEGKETVSQCSHQPDAQFTDLSIFLCSSEAEENIVWIVGNHCCRDMYRDMVASVSTYRPIGWLCTEKGPTLQVWLSLLAFIHPTLKRINNTVGAEYCKHLYKHREQSARKT